MAGKAKKQQKQGDKQATGKRTSGTKPDRVAKTTAARTVRKKSLKRSSGAWRAPSDREDPVDILIRSNEKRIKNLVPIRYGRMMQSPIAFYRGAAAIMAADLARTPTSGIIVQACGDCHLMNFGGF